MSSSARNTANASEIDAAVSKLTSYKNVVGYLVLTRSRTPEDRPALIRLGGPEFEGALNSSSSNENEQGKDDSRGPSPASSAMAQTNTKKRDAVKAVIKLVGQTLGGVSDAASELDQGELRFVRIRTATREVMIAPSPDFVLAVVQDPTVSP